ncbi:craniofacial development protein 1 [Trematomus bernacchii]|uniref:craniofacial development protein 1 n=1 Tax=Trematomus bernacchii TaxID=40690 RepID=UPI00146DFF0F|nr:craniofacial development protein 1 [Trematomus bernacchii]
MMDYDDYDSDGYSSNEDADYVPSDDNLSEDDLNECEKEDPLNESDTVPHDGSDSKKKRIKKDISVRKRKKGVLKIDNEEGDGAEAEERPQEEVEQLTKVGPKAEDKLKKKSDDLWASFLSDVGTRPKESAPAAQAAQSAQSGSTQKEDSSVLKVAPSSKDTKAPEPAKVTITQVFDFAGEEVRVNKVVSADSKEAKMYLESQKEDEEDEEETSGGSQPPLPGPSVKRPAGMSSIMNRLGGKKLKMSTLEKSKMDWDAFKSEEGITEELAIHNRGKEGYVERKSFLDRVDHRQFEREKAVRQSNVKQ